MIQLIFSCIFFIILAIIATIKPKWAIIGTFCYLVFLGFIRRVITYYGAPVDFDPLIIVGPLIAILLFVLPTKNDIDNTRKQTSISYLVLGLIAVMILEIFNPAQGGMMAGFSGAIFTLIPLLWFWIGRKYANEDFLEQIFLKTIVPMGIAAALYGLWQTFYGFAPFESSWVNYEVYNALSAGGTLRAFSFLTSASEYANLINITLIIIVSGFSFQYRKLAWFIPLIVISLFLESSRGPIILLILTLALILAAKKTLTHYWLRFSLILVSLSLITFFAISLVGRITVPDSVTGLVFHQVSGLQNPLDPTNSTLTSHFSLMVQGIQNSFTKPQGYGLSATNLGNKFSAIQSLRTEVDFSDNFITTGVVGGILYLALIILILVRAFRFFFQAQSLISFAILGLLVISLGNWLQGGHYAMVSIIWFTIGALDQISSHNQKMIVDPEAN